MNVSVNMKFTRFMMIATVCVAVFVALSPHAHAGHESEQIAKPCAVCQVHHNLTAIETDHHVVSDPARPCTVGALSSELDMTSRDAGAPARPRAPPVA